MAEELGKYFSANREACWEETARTAPLVKSLQELTLRFSQRYAEKKREGNFLDYSDLEHQAIRACFWGRMGSPPPRPGRLAARFDEIMIDEYQDINEVQDSLFRAVSQNGKKPVYGGGRKAEHLRLPPGHAGNFPPGQKGLSEV